MAPSPAGGERFTKELRLRARRQFLRVQEQGEKMSVGPLLAITLPSTAPDTRLGITVTSKVGNAVTRARIRRHLRELFRKRRGCLPAGLDLVLVARGAAKDADFATLSWAFDGVVAKLSARGPPPEEPS